MIEVFIKLNETNFNLLSDKKHGQHCPPLRDIDRIHEICEQAPEFSDLSERFFLWVLKNNTPSFQYLKSAPLFYRISNKAYQKNYDQLVKKQNQVEFPDLLSLEETSPSETDTVLFFLKGPKLKCLPTSVVNYVKSESTQKK